MTRRVVGLAGIMALVIVCVPVTSSPPPEDKVCPRIYPVPACAEVGVCVYSPETCSYEDTGKGWDDLLAD